MKNTVVMLSPDAAAVSSGDSHWPLPPHLVDAIRGRVRLLALLLVAAFAVNPLAHFLLGVSAAWIPVTLPAHFERLVRVDIVATAAALVSGLLWWAARGQRLAPQRLLTLALGYEVVVCFAVALLTFWESSLRGGGVPRVTWVIGVIILFPLVMPGPPRLMLLAAVAAAHTPLAALWVLRHITHTDVAPDYFGVLINPLVAAGFAYFGARVVYGLGREVAEARELGSYRLEARIGQGGMGEVWRARHRLLARPAAVKLVRPPVSGAALPAAAWQRFEREAQTIAALRSPHTVTLFDFGIAENGSFYYVMELLNGVDIDQLVRRFGPQSPGRVVYLLRQVCHSLAEAEANGLVHRDIKPANIFLCRYGRDVDFVKVLDFGLVKTVGGPREPQPTITDENSIPGTPAFMAPEQARGVADVDIRADIYALGCVAYWLLTARTVFTAATGLAQLHAHVNTKPEPPSMYTPEQIPAALDLLVLDCLAKEPSDRPQGAAELAQRLASIDDESWTATAAAEWWQKNMPTP